MAHNTPIWAKWVKHDKRITQGGPTSSESSWGAQNDKQVAQTY